MFGWRLDPRGSASAQALNIAFDALAISFDNL